MVEFAVAASLTLAGRSATQRGTHGDWWTKLRRCPGRLTTGARATARKPWRTPMVILETIIDEETRGSQFTGNDGFGPNSADS